MATTFIFSEKKIKSLPVPSGKDREYHKDKTFPSLQICITSSGSRTYYLVQRMDGKPTRYRLGTTLELSVDQARDAAAIQTGKRASGQNPQADRRTKREEPTLQVLWEHWLLYARAHKKPRSVEEDERNYRVHLSHWHNRRLGTIKKSEVQALHSKIGRTYEKTIDGKPVTMGGTFAANRVLALLRAMYNKADDIGYRGPNPAKGITQFKETQRDRFLQADELENFFKALEAEPQLFRDFFLLSLLTGARKSNLLAMRWVDITLDSSEGFWRIPETKANMPVIVPLTAPAVAILSARKETANGAPWVFPGHKRGTHLQTPQKRWDQILKNAKLENLHIHDLRRSLGSWMASNNVSLTIVGGVLGHKPGSQATAIYGRLMLDPRRQAMEGATSAMLTAGKQTKMLTIDVEAKEVVSHGNR